jgi:predicted amidohydrolase
MRIGFISKGRAGAFIEEILKKEPCERKDFADVYVFCIDGKSDISYERELKGETTFFEDAARLSGLSKGVVVCGCVTDTRGHKRKSALVAENGRLLGVSDMLHAIDGEVGSGAVLRVYDTKIGRMGVAVAEDLLFPDVIRSLAVCGSDFIVCPYGKTGEMQSVLLRANAYCYGVPILFCADGYCMLAESSGELSFASPQGPSIAELKNKKEYHLVETRRRGRWGR